MCEPSSQTKQLLNDIVDARASKDPKAIYAELPLSPTSFDDGFRKVTYWEFANAINGMAWWMMQKLGTGKDFETLLYLGPSDIRHNVLLLGAVKAGYKMLFTSPRYSVPAQSTLIKSLGCRKMLSPKTQSSVADEIIKTCDLEVYRVPELDELLNQVYPHFKLDKTFDDAKSEPLVALHTSGTTGLPRPVIWTHDWAASFAEERILAPPPGFDHSDRLQTGKRILNMFPCFHAGFLFGSILMGIFSHTITIYPLSDIPATAQVAIDCLKHVKVECIVGAPPLLEGIGENPHVLEAISRNVKTLFWAGGGISSTAGNAIASKLKLYNTCGSTEMGMWPTLQTSDQQSSDRWADLRVHPAMNMEFRYRSNDLYEAVIIRNRYPQYEQPVFKIYPDINEYSSNDLFSPHPLDPSLWRHRGRVDDMQVFVTGEKFHPTGVEQHIARHPNVNEVLLVGTRRPQTALLIEMKPDIGFATVIGRAETIERLWPTLTEANQLSPSYAKITESHILFTIPEKPMARFSKGTVQRPATVELYREELDALFGNAAA